MPALAALGVVSLVGMSAGPVLAAFGTLTWGGGLDVIKAAWTHWWAAANGWASFTDLVSFPTGQYGSTITPVGILLLSPVQWVLGPVASFNALALLSLGLVVAGVVLLTWELTGSRNGAAVAALATLVGRPVFGHIATGNHEGLATGWLLLACWAGLRWADPRRSGGGGLLVGLLFAVTALESPYHLVLVPPLALGFALLRRRSAGWQRQWVLAALAGAGPVLARLWLYRHSFGPTNAGAERITRHLGLGWRYFDTNPGLGPYLFRPGDAVGVAPVFTWNEWYFLGWSALLLALVGAVTSRRGRVMAALALAFAALGAGSFPLGLDAVPGPYLLVNTVLAPLGTALSSPERYLVDASAALALAAGCGIGALSARVGARPATLLALASLALLLGEAATIGGPSRPHQSWSSSTFACFRDPGIQGGVHVVTPPAPSADHQAAQYLMQLAHRLPSSHAGFRNWAAAPRPPEVDQALGATDAAASGTSSLRPDLAALERMGFAWLAVPSTSTAAWLPAPRRTCDGWSLHALADARGADEQVRSPSR